MDIETLKDREKNAKDVGLVVVLDTGELYNHTLHPVATDPHNLAERQYHGVLMWCKIIRLLHERWT